MPSGPARATGSFARSAFEISETGSVRSRKPMGARGGGGSTVRLATWGLGAL